MAQASVKLIFSFVMVFSLLAPVVAPFCAEDWYRQVMTASSEEEHQDHSQENLKKLTDKDLFVYEFDFQTVTYRESRTNNFRYQISENILSFDVILPPPEHIV